MTGLDTDRDSTIEIATVVTDSQLNILADGPELAISHPLSTLEAMDDWHRTQPAKSGLWRRELAEGVPMAEADARPMEFRQPMDGPNPSAVCGNSNYRASRSLP